MRVVRDRDKRFPTVKYQRGTVRGRNTKLLLCHSFCSNGGATDRRVKVLHLCKVLPCWTDGFEPQKDQVPISVGAHQPFTL